MPKPLIDLMHAKADHEIRVSQHRAPVMADASSFSFPFDMASVADDMQRRFGWNAENLNAAMSQLMPAAMAGFRHFSPAPPNLFSFNPAQSGQFDFLNPLKFFESYTGGKADDRLMPFFGPESVRKAVADQIAQATGLQQKAVQEMMPVAATLAMAQLTRPYLHGEAQELFDAFMRGFIRGRPKPAPKPMDYVQGYTDAVTAFWTGFLKPFGREEEPAAEAEENEPEAEIEAEEEPNLEAGTGESSELDQMMSSWMAASRDFQSNQFKAFDQLFSRAATDFSGTPSKPGE